MNNEELIIVNTIIWSIRTCSRGTYVVIRRDCTVNC